MPLAHASLQCGAHTRATRLAGPPGMPAGRCRCTAAPAATGRRTAKGLERLWKARMTHRMRSAGMEHVRKMIRDLEVAAELVEVQEEVSIPKHCR
jgi:hypothetical protein